jgi:plastocyanin
MRGGSLNEPHTLDPRRTVMKYAILGAGMALALMLSLGNALSAETVEVEILDYAFNPAELEVPVGTTVRWVNAERRTSHDVYFPEEDIGSPRFFPEETWERTFDEPGTYPYYCRPHEERDMQGVIVVKAAD